MKKIALKLILAILFVAASNVKAQTSSTPALDYMNQMSEICDGMKNETWQYLKAVTRGKGARKVEKKRIQLIEKTGELKSQVRAIKAFTIEGAYKKAVLDYLQMHYTVLKEDYDKILDMEDIAEQSYDAMEAYILAQELASEKLEEAFNELRAAQEVFAKANNINLIEGEGDKKSQKIKKASEALGYYNDVYLIFFKSYKQEAYIMDALSKGDVSALEQNINTMVTFNAEGLSKLDTLQHYNEDGSLKKITKEIFTYFDKEAKEYYPSMVNFFVAKDNFEKMTKLIESKKKNQRTKEDVENYNKAVETFNKEVNTYNKTNELANTGRQEIMQKWNKSVEEFFDRHSN